MSNTPARPGFVQPVIADILRRVGNLERLRRHEQAGRPMEIHFSFPEAFAVGAAHRKDTRTGYTVTGVTVSLTVAGTATSAAVLKKNGSTFKTVTLASGQTKGTDEKVSPNVSFEPGVDYLTCEVTARGTSAEGLNVQVWARTRG